MQKTINSTTKIYWEIFKERFLPWATAGLVALSSNWAAEAIPATFRIWLSGSLSSFFPARAIAIALFLGSMYLLYLQRNTFFKPRTRYLTNEETEKRKHLLLFLSNLRRDVVYQNGVPPGLTLTWNLADDLSAIEQHKKSNPPWSWEMGLRAVLHHLPELQSVTVTCSTSSIKEVGLFFKILRKYPELDGVTLRVLCKNGDKTDAEFMNAPEGTYSGLDFEDFDELSDILWSFLKRRKLPEEEVMVDITSGQKVTSAVAMALTFNRRIKAQYIQTNAPWRVVSYDVVHAFYDTGGLG